MTKLILTPNRQLADDLIYNLNKTHISKAWLKPNVKTYSEWLLELFDQVNFSLKNPLLPLSESAAEVLWQSIILESKYITANSATVKTIIDAWKLFWSYDIGFDRLNSYATYYPETKVFYSWARMFYDYCINMRVIDNARFESLVINNHELLFDLPTSIVLYKFEHVTPGQQCLFDRLKLIPTEYSAYSENKADVIDLKQIYDIVECSSIEQELILALQEAKHVVTTAQNSSVGILLFDLRNNIDLVNNLIVNLNMQSLTCINHTISLAHMPIIKSIFNLLAICKPVFTWPELKAVLLDRNIFSINIGCEVVLVLSKLANNLDYTLNLSLVLDALGKYEDLSLTQWFIVLKQKIYAFDINIKHTSQQYALFLQDLLLFTGWPNINESIEELSIIWRDFILDYVTLDLAIPAYYFSDCVKYLKQLAENSSFMQKNQLKPIQIYDFDYALGLEFDNAWCINFSSSNWPKESTPNPFLPLTLQQKLQVPKSSSVIQFNCAKIATQILIASTKKINFSYSVLYQHVKHFKSRVVSCNVVIAKNVAVDFVFNRSTLEVYNDCDFIILPNPKGYPTAFVSAQLECNFKAFAKYTLNLRTVITPKIFLTANQKGDIVHAVLANIWKCLRDKQSLIKYIAQDKLLDLVINIIDIELDKWKKRKQLSLSDIYWQHEKQVISNTIMSWLQMEALREEDFKVSEIEQSFVLDLSNVKINGKIDRVDVLNSEGKIVIDYKTGDSFISKWIKPDQMIEAQMPMYALTIKSNDLLGVVIASIKNNNFTGVAVQENLLTNLKQVNLSELYNLWHQKLSFAIFEYFNGNIKVNPINAEVCRYCDFKALCRIDCVN